MNKKITVFIITMTISFTSLAGWVSDWASQSTHSGPKYFETSQRGFFHGGSYTARFRNKNEHLFSIQTPRIKSGCGGIDLFAGGFSFLDPEYLVQKLQRALQAAPAVIFDLAMKELCPECSATIKELEAIINNLNSMQISECGIAQQIAAPLYEGLGGKQTSIATNNGIIDSVLSLSSGATKNTQDLQKKQNQDNAPVTDQKTAIDGCSTEFKKIFTTDGSLLTNIATTKGLEIYADYMRAYVGDVTIKYQSKQYLFTPIPSCNNMDVTKIDDIILGNAMTRPADGTKCIASKDKSLITVVESRLKGIADKIKTKSAFTVKELEFLNSIPFDIHGLLSAAVRRQNVDVYIDSSKDVLARMMAYALVDDLIGNIREMVKIADNNAKLASSSGNKSQSCEPGVITGILNQVDSFREETIELSKAVRLARSRNIQEINNNITFNRNIQKQMQK